jgi:hypothetical protein
VGQLHDLRLRQGLHDLRSCLLLQKLVATAAPSSAVTAGQHLLVSAPLCKLRGLYIYLQPLCRAWLYSHTACVHSVFGGWWYVLIRAPHQICCLLSEHLLCPHPVIASISFRV